MSTDTDHPPPIVWVLADDRAGNVAQARGVAEALGLPTLIKDIRYTKAARLPNSLRPGLVGLDADSRGRLAPPWPGLVIGAGRRVAPVARWIKRQADVPCKLVQIMDPGPGAGRADFDLIVVPSHDARPPKGANVLTVTGAPHGVTEAALAQARRKWKGRFADLPRPMIALIVGGATKNRPFSDDLAAELGRIVGAMRAAEGGAILLTTSRRTGRTQEAALMAAMGDGPLFDYRWGADGDNPYLGYLALADAIVVTGDSVSMCSEACGTGKPVYIFAPPGFAAPKHARLHQALVEGGHARMLKSDTRLEDWSHPPLNAAADIARAIRDRFGLAP